MKYKGNNEKLRNLNQNWEHMTWDEEGLRAECAKFSPEALAKFESFGARNSCSIRFNCRISDLVIIEHSSGHIGFGKPFCNKPNSWFVYGGYSI